MARFFDPIKTWWHGTPTWRKVAGLAVIVYGLPGIVSDGLWWVGAVGPFMPILIVVGGVGVLTADLWLPQLIGREGVVHLVEAELVAICAEGETIAGDGFVGDPAWDEIVYWTQSSTAFIEYVLGPKAKDQLARVDEAPSRRELLLARVAAVRRVLDAFTKAHVRKGRREVQEAIEDRRNAPKEAIEAAKAKTASVTPRGAIDELMRDGLDLMEEVSRPMEPVTDEKGAVSYVVGPRGADLDAVQAFDDRAREMLRAIRPSLLSDYATAANAFLQRNEEKKEKRSAKLQKLDNAAKLREWAENTHRKPATYLEALLEGLTAARNRLDQ